MTTDTPPDHTPATSGLRLTPSALLTAVESAQAVAEYAPDGTLRAANPRFLALLGSPGDELLGRFHANLCLPADGVHERSVALWEQLAQGEAVQQDFLYLALDGRHVWLHSQFAPVPGADGSLQSVVQFATDITDLRQHDAEVQAMLNAIDHVQAVIEFDLSGHVLHANQHFLDLMGYQLDEIRGRHHRLFCDPDYAASPAYARFWEQLGSGRVHDDEFKRLAKDGREVWIRASYNPVFDPEGHAVRVVKFAADITDARLQHSEMRALLAAIDHVQAVIEFDLSGHVLHANEKFLNLMGYRLDEVRGQHHRLFCEPSYAASPAYTQFWDQLGRGQVHDQTFKRLGKDGKEVWIRASYNPVFDPEGHPVKVVKFATDITAVRQQQAEMQGLLAAIDHVQAVIEFDLRGHVLRANRNFLNLMGYQPDEVVGQHHRMFCEPDYARSPAYKRFWEHLASGQVHDDEFKRLGKHGREVWIRASYNPVFDPEGRLVKVVKFATDITESKTQRLDDVALRDAFDRVQSGLGMGTPGGSSDTHH